MLEKVTAFILREQPAGLELLAINHPFTGYQFPAGTVEVQELPEKAVRREILEETGLQIHQPIEFLEYRDTYLNSDEAVLCQASPVFSRPDPSSFNWIHIRSGIKMQVLQQNGEYIQIKYAEPNKFPDADFITFEIIGWVHQANLTNHLRRYFYLAQGHFDTPEQWDVYTDGHCFTLSWFSLDNPPNFVPPQDEWLTILMDHLPTSA